MELLLLIGFLLLSTSGRTLTTCLCILSMKAKVLRIKLFDLRIFYWLSNSNFSKQCQSLKENCLAYCKLKVGTCFNSRICR